MFSSTQRCSNCGHAASKDAAFCPNCGQRLAGGTRRCGLCNTENRSDARFCKKCGTPLDQSATAEVYQHRWTRPDEEFAVRIEADDLTGLLKRGLKIEPGCNAMLLEHGANRGLLPPGEYTLGTLGQRLKDWFTGDIPERVTVLLVGLAPADLEFHLGGRYTKDPLPIGMSVRLQVEVAEPGKFLINLLGSRERLSKEDVRQYLYPEVVQVADRWLREHTLQELAEDSSQRARFELALEEALRTTFAQSGLRFLQARTVELNLEPYDKIRGVRGSYTLLEAEALADLEGRKRVAATEAEKKRFAEEEKLLQAQIEVDARRRWTDLNKERNLLELAEETGKVEREERLADLYERMRQAVMSDKMKEVRSTADFETFLDQVDYEKLLREKERADLVKSWKEQAEDHDKARAHLLAKLEVERNYEVRAAEIKGRSDLSTQELDGELRLARLRATGEQEIEASRWEFDLRRRRADEQFQQEQDEARLRQEELQRRARLGLEGAEHDEEIRQMDAELELGLKGLRGIKQVRLEAERGQWEIEREKREFEWTTQQKQLEVELQRERIQLEHELNRLDRLGQLGTEALISVSGVEQARVLADLKKAEAFKGMSEEQILALAAKDSPDVARALGEKFRSIAEGQASKETAEMYERLLAERETSLRAMKEEADRRTREVSEAWDKSSARAQETAGRALDRMADTAQAFARGKGESTPPIIITPGAGGPQVISTTPGQGPTMPTPLKTCPNCGRSVPEDARHCEHCGHKFEGVG